MMLVCENCDEEVSILLVEASGLWEPFHAHWGTGALVPFPAMNICRDCWDAIRCDVCHARGPHTYRLRACGHHCCPGCQMPACQECFQVVMAHTEDR